MRDLLKGLVQGLATFVVLPALLSFHVRRVVMGDDRALEGSTQALALIPGLIGVYLRGAFLAAVLDQAEPAKTWPPSTGGSTRGRAWG